MSQNSSPLDRPIVLTLIGIFGSILVAWLSGEIPIRTIGYVVFFLAVLSGFLYLRKRALFIPIISSLVGFVLAVSLMRLTPLEEIIFSVPVATSSTPTASNYSNSTPSAGAMAPDASATMVPVITSTISPTTVDSTTPTPDASATMVPVITSTISPTTVDSTTPTPSIQKIIEDIISRSRLVSIDPKGELSHDSPKPVIQLENSRLHNFVVEAKFTNPAIGDWSYGFVFRRTQKLGSTPDVSFTACNFYVNSNDHIWHLKLYKFKDGKVEQISNLSGYIPNLNMGSNESNSIQLITVDNTLYITINNELVKVEDISLIDSSGYIGIATAFDGLFTTGQVTRYEDFTIKSLDP